MLIALIADVHANILALEAVLKSIRQKRPIACLPLSSTWYFSPAPSSAVHGFSYLTTQLITTVSRNAADSLLFCADCKVREYPFFISALRQMKYQACPTA